jgi:hypothetical protein
MRALLGGESMTRESVLELLFFVGLVGFLYFIVERFGGSEK